MEQVLEKTGLERVVRRKGSVTVQLFEPNMRVTVDSFSGKLFPVTLEDASKFSVKRHMIGVTKTQIIEFTSDMYGTGYMTAMDCHSIESLVKVKFKRGSIIAFHFKSNNVKRYNMFDCVECVSTIKSIMSQSGVSATHSSQKHSLNVANAQNLLEKVRSLEEQFSVNPSHSLVTELMDHLREAVECFGEANDDRYEGVIAHIQAFLQRADVLAILDPACHPLSRPSEAYTISVAGDNLARSEIPVAVAVADDIPKVASSFADSFSALASDLAAFEQLFSEANMEEDFEFEEEFANDHASSSLPGAGSANSELSGVDISTEFRTRPQRMDSLEFELNDMLGNISMEFESLVGNVDDIKVSNSSRRNSSIGGAEKDFDAFIASL